MTINWEKVRKVFITIGLFSAVFLSHILISQAAYFSLSANRLAELYDINIYFENLTDIICIILIPVFFYSLVRLTTLFDISVIPQVLEANAKSTKERISLFFKIKKFYYEFLILTFLWLILPREVCYYPLWNVFLRANDTTFPNIIYMVIFLAVMYLFFMLGKLSAIVVIPLPKQKSEPLLRHRIYLQKKSREGQDSFFKQYFIVIFAYLLGPLCLVLGIPAVLSVIQLVIYTFSLKLLLIIISVILLFSLLSYIRAFSKRRRFLLKMKKVVLENNIDISEISNPYKSLFQIYDGEDFNFVRGGKKYSCKILHSKRKGVPMFISEGGICTFVHTFILFKMKVFSYNTSYKFDFESENKKIIIINPVPNDIFNAFDGRVVSLDNGDVIGGYKIFTGSGFLNALERNCIDR